MNNRNINTLSPFVTFCQKVLPLAFDESLSYYECLCALRDYIDQMSKSVNNNADAVTELQAKYKEFTEYVKNYISDLNVQTEINNKLDEMAQDGTLANIINQDIFSELNTKVNANTAKTTELETEVNQIESKVNQNTANITTVQADVLKNTNDITSLTTKVNQNTSDITQLKKDVKNVATVKKNILIIGDSYSSDESESVALRDNSESWVQIYKRLTGNTVTNLSENGAGYCRKSSTNNRDFVGMLNNFLAGKTEDELKAFNSILIYGGLNDIDQNFTVDQVNTNFNTLYTLLKNNFVNAKIHVFFFNQPKRPIKIANREYTQKFIENLQGKDVVFYRCASFLLGSQNNFAADNYHPNANGSTRLANLFNDILETGTSQIRDKINYSGMYLQIPESSALGSTASYQNDVYFYPAIGKLCGNLSINLTSYNVNPAGVYAQWSVDSNMIGCVEEFVPQAVNYAATDNHKFSSLLGNTYYVDGFHHRIYIDIYNPTSTQITVNTLAIHVDADINN